VDQRQSRGEARWLHHRRARLARTWTDRAGCDRTPSVPGHELSGVVVELGYGVHDRRAVLAGGCFWRCRISSALALGVLFTRVGYTGGDTPNATYRNHGSHAEAIEITYDPSATIYRELLEFFFQIHDLSTPNRQGNDVGDVLPVGDLLPRRRTAGSPRTRSPMSTPAGCGRASDLTIGDPSDRPRAVP
jgi:Peptide methionine sulfoxide reductase